MTLLKQSSATKIGCVPLFYREINVKCISFVEKRCWQESREGYRIEKNLLAMWRAKIPSGFEEKFLFTKIEYLRESVPFRNPSSNFPREISSHWHWMHATHILYSLSLGGNIQKVFRVFKVTWYCCSTNELSWGKGCHRGFSHRSYIGIRKDYWLKSWKHKNTREVRLLRLFLRNHLSKLKSFVLVFSPWVGRNIERKVLLFSRRIRQTENYPLKRGEESDIALPVH